MPILSDRRYTLSLSPLPADNGIRDIYFDDGVTGDTTLISLSGLGLDAGTITKASISDSGDIIAFQIAFATSEGDGSANDGEAVEARPDIVVIYNRQTGETKLVSVGDSEASPDAEASAPPTPPTSDGGFFIFAADSLNFEAGEMFLQPVGGDAPGLAADSLNFAIEDATDTEGVALTLQIASVGAGPELISKNSDGVQATSTVLQGSTMTQGRDTISANGRYVVFESSANNLDLDISDTNNIRDVFWHDRETGETRRVSLSTDGVQANQPTNHNTALGATISGDGRYVAFQSPATNLLGVGADANNQTDIFVHDTETGSTERLSVLSSGVNGLQSNGFSSNAALSHDGRYVVFSSTATTLVSGDTNVSDIFWHDRLTGETKKLTVGLPNAMGNPTLANGASTTPSISADGKVVVFQSSANNLAANDTGTILDVYVHYVDTGETRLVSANLNGVSSGAQALSPRVSADGNWVVFSSGGNLTGGPNDTGTDVFLHHLPTGTTTRVDVSSPDANGIVVFSNGNSNSPMVSGDGRFIVWEEFGTNLIPGDTATFDILMHDRLTGQTTRVSQNAAGEGGNGNSLGTAISDDGGTIVFASTASNLLLPTADTNGREDVFAVSNTPDTVSLQLQEGPLAFVYSEDGFVIDQVAANAGFGGTPDLGTVPLTLALIGSPSAQMHIHGDNGIGMRSPGENPGLVGQTFSKQEGLRIAIDDEARFDVAYSAEIGIGNVVTPANKGAVKVVAYLDDQLVFQENFALKNGQDRVVEFDPDGDLAFDRIEIYAADGNAIQFSVTGVEFGLVPASAPDLIV
jgi:hypothetical protein